MTPRAVLFILPVLVLASCGNFPDGVPVYVGDNRVGTLPGSGGGAATVAGTAVDECQRLALRAADPSITDAQRRAAAEYRASIGC